MSKREAAPLTARLLTRRRRAAPADAVPLRPAKARSQAPPQPAKTAPRAHNVHTATPTVHAVDLTPPDFLRSENRETSAPAKKRRDDPA